MWTATETAFSRKWPKWAKWNSLSKRGRGLKWEVHLRNCCFLGTPELQPIWAVCLLCLGFICTALYYAALKPSASTKCDKRRGWNKRCKERKGFKEMGMNGKIHGIDWLIGGFPNIWWTWPGKSSGEFVAGQDSSLNRIPYLFFRNSNYPKICGKSE